MRQDPVVDKATLSRASNQVQTEPPKLTSDTLPGPKPCKLKTFSLLTYKLHALGNYVCTIQWFGTSDSYSTQPVHCHVFIYLIYETDCALSTG
jgi:hypothetical protein